MKLFNGITSYARMLLAAKPSRGELGMLSCAIFSAIASGVPFPIIGIIFGQLLNDFNAVTCLQAEDESSAATDAYQKDVNSKVLMILYLAIAQFVTIYSHLLCWSLYGARLAQRLRETYLRSLLRQEPSFFDELPPGEVDSRLSADIQTIRSGTSEKVGICLSSVSFFVTAYIVAFIKDYELAAILISLIPAYFIMSFVGSYYVEKYSGLIADFTATAASIASEALSSVVVVQAFGANSRLEAKFSEALDSSKKVGLKKATAIGIQSGIMYFIAYAANGLAFWQGSKSIADAAAGIPSNGSVGATFTVIFILIECKSSPLKPPCLGAHSKQLPWSSAKSPPSFISLAPQWPRTASCSARWSASPTSTAPRMPVSAFPRAKAASSSRMFPSRTPPAPR
jgi:ATP-binding cassette, subfamily B (MDR/TAP), member 1